MKNKENLPDILLKANYSLDSAEKFLKIFGINKVFLTFIARRIRESDFGDFIEEVTYGFVGHLEDNYIKIDEYAGVLETDRITSTQFTYNNLEFNISHYNQCVEIQNNYLVINNYDILEYNTNVATLVYFNGKSVYNTKLEIKTSKRRIDKETFFKYFEEKYKEKTYLVDRYTQELNTNMAYIPKEATEDDFLLAANRYCKEFNFKMFSWEKCKKKIYGMYGVPIQTINKLEQLFKTEYPYVYKFFLSKYSIDNEFIIPFICCPQMEILIKAGYTGLEKILRVLWNYCQYFDDISSKLNKFNILIKEGNSPKDIIQMSPKLATTLMECSDLNTWDTYRKLEKKKHISTSLLIDMYEEGYDENVMKKIGEILRRKYDDKNIFTQESLLNYLERLDRFEAIDRYEAAQLLSDYLRMCEQLNLKPKIDGDSLKREHDICARMVRQIRKEGLENGIVEHGKKLSKFSFAKGHYKIVPIQDYDDLIQQANSQHNCVASYAESILKHIKNESLNIYI